MPGKVIRVIEATEFDFTKLDGDNDELSITVATKIGATKYSSGVLQVRVHEITFEDKNGETIKIYVKNDGSTEEDPAQTFYSSSIATISITQSDSAGTFITTPLCKAGQSPDVEIGIGSMLAVIVQGIRAQAATSKEFKAKISADLVLRES